MAKETFISLLKQEIPIKEELLDIFELKFYKENPRIASIIQKEKKKGIEITDELIDEKLWGLDGTHKIFRRIEKHGGLINPIVVYNCEVIEGNTRLCCYRHLYSNAKKENKDADQWRSINCKVLLKELEKKQIYALLGDEHIVGKIEWGTYEKAMWMKQMMDEKDFNIEDVKRVTSLSESTIRTYIEAYETMVEEEINDPKKFSHVEQLVRNAEIKRIEKRKDPEIKKKVIDAIKNNQISQAMDVRKVTVIWKDKKSKKKFEMGENIVQVYSDLKAKVPTIDHVFVKAAEDVYKRMRKLTRTERGQMAEDSKCRYIIKILSKESKVLCDEFEKIHGESCQ